jgi:hypothetical protein
MTHADIIAAKGAAEIAGRLQIPAINVRMWKSRNTIPRSAWAELIDAYPDVTLDALKAGEHHRLAANDDTSSQDRAA